LPLSRGERGSFKWLLRVIEMANLGKTIVKDMYVGAKPELFRLARNMRNNPTEAEKILWQHLRKFRSLGFVFRRQHPIDFYIADFYCDRIKLVVEVDGEYHSNRDVFEYDDSRSGELERFGIRVIRFRNEEVINNIEQVILAIKKIISELSSPSLIGRGGQEGERPLDEDH
jgi:very-short-patch-repair endonuclease